MKKVFLKMQVIRLFAIICASGLMLSSCGEEFIGDEANPIVIDNDASVNHTVFTFSDVNGNVGSILNEKGQSVSQIIDMDQYVTSASNYLHIDVDKMEVLPMSFTDLRNWADAYDVNLLLESGSNNFEKMQSFYEEHFNNGKEVDYDLQGIIIKNVINSDKTQYTLIGSSFLSANNLVYAFFPHLVKEEIERENELMLKKFNEENVVDQERTQGYYRTVYNEIWKPANTGSHKYKTENFKVLTQQPNITSYDVEQSKWVKEGLEHFAVGVCKGQQSASYGTTMSYSKSWTAGVGVSLTPGLSSAVSSAALQSASFSANWSTGKTTTSGVSNTSTLSMHKQYAKGGIKQITRKNSGWFYHVVEYDLIRQERSGRKRRKKIGRIKATFDDRTTTWSGLQPRKQEYFTWEEWGNTLPDC